ncbi:glutamyl-tRNA reductase [Flavisolibacter tropicus]|uniref:Glutamyl-tRNA reductase n=1 Tax=Flavisolibacter tropicus TaxID=1492898 RepID=A0A172TVM4_9BACT|nr:glutamyl-tRNA reductase [Flavisolibacter tropicus]ANE51129.1 glutamyl-tRNA reductase [Flavisolibacter tropicus]
MNSNDYKHISNFYVAGINYKKSDASIRGQFAITNEQYEAILTLAAERGLNELFILSTCNRTEIYGFGYSSEQLIDLLCSQTAGDAATFKKAAYIKKGQHAVEHVFQVGAGLDSQILGDYEIVGQLKTAVKFSKERGFVGAFTERLINCVLQSSKLIKNSTALSGGTVSVSFAAVQYIRDTVTDIRSKNILLLGVGKIGRNTCKNLVDYLETTNITLINRTTEKAAELANELGLSCAPLSDLDAHIKKADIILVATNAAEPTILKSHLEGGSQKLIIDLSIPYNVEDAAQLLPNVQMVNVDELSKLKDETLKKREAEVPKAKGIIGELMIEFMDWYDMRKHVPLLKDLKSKLKSLYTHHQHLHLATTTCPKTLDVQIQRVLNDTAGKIKLNNQRGCQYINAITEFISAKN